MPNSGVLIGESDETGIGIEQLSAEEFRGIADYVHGKIVGACQNILDGKLPVRPYRSLVDGVMVLPTAMWPTSWRGMC